MPLYEVGMHKEQWVMYEADTAAEALRLATIDNPEWVVLGANDAQGELVSPLYLRSEPYGPAFDLDYDGSQGPDKEGWDD